MTKETGEYIRTGKVWENPHRMTGVMETVEEAARLVVAARSLGLGADMKTAGVYPLSGCVDTLKPGQAYYAVETSTPEQCTIVWDAFKVKLG